MQDASQAALDFEAVQRGDAEMDNKMNRVIRAAIERRGENPIVSIHGQGAGGNGNVLKEISAPNGHRYPFSECFVAIISNKYKKIHIHFLIPR